MNLSQFAVAVMALFLALPVYAGENVDVEALVSEALAHNPEIHAGEAQWQMYVAKARAAGRLDDPMLMLKIQNAMISDPFAFNKDETTAKVIGISQMLPFYGKRDLLKASAAAEAEAARSEFDERKVELRKMILETLARLSYNQESLRLLDENIQLIKGLGSIAERSYGAGMAKQQDVLQSQIELSRMQEMRLSLEQQQQSLGAMFAALLHRPIGTAAPQIPAGIVPVTQTFDQLVEKAIAARPALQARLARLDAARSGVKLAQREYYPDVTLSLEYMQRDRVAGDPDSGEDMYTAGITVNLPVQLEKRRAMVAEAEAQTRMLDAEVEGLRHEIRRGVSETLGQMRASEKMAELYEKGMVPQAVFAADSLLASYRAGKGELMPVLEARMRVLSMQQQQAGFVAEHRMQRATLEALVGTKID